MAKEMEIEQLRGSPNHSGSNVYLKMVREAKFIAPRGCAMLFLLQISLKQTYKLHESAIIYEYALNLFIRSYQTLLLDILGTSERANAPTMT